jgi:cysteinyl-tRNA synthetase
MRQLNVLPPSIEPRASGHIIEQIDLVSRILQSPFAYVADGSVYFDVPTYNQSHPYGVLSNRNISDILSDTRALDGQQDKRHPADFALWKRALPQHIMRWPSPWSEGFPGWHCECTAMARKYLGDHFDIHGGGIDLVFPHHEAEIAQATAAFGQPMVNTWVHNNLITVNGKKMGKSLGNFIPLDHFHPMTIRFFILQAHYRSTLDFSQPALDAAHKALQRLFDAFNRLPLLHTQPNAPIPAPLDNLAPRCFEALDDDLNTPTVIALLFDAAHAINTAYDNHTPLPPQLIPSLQQDFKLLFTDLLGVLPPTTHSLPDLQPFHLALDLLLELRALAKANKDWNTADLIRDRLASLGFTIADTKAGSQWTRNPQPSTNTSIQP